MSNQTSNCCKWAHGNAYLRWADPDDFYGTGREKKDEDMMPVGWYWHTAAVLEGEETKECDVLVTRCPECGGLLPNLASST